MWPRNGAIYPGRFPSDTRRNSFELSQRDFKPWPRRGRGRISGYHFRQRRAVAVDYVLEQKAVQVLRDITRDILAERFEPSPQLAIALDRLLQAARFYGDPLLVENILGKRHKGGNS